MAAHKLKNTRTQATKEAQASAMQFANSSFNFGSGHHQATSSKQKKSIIGRSQTGRALIGFAAQHRIKPLPPSAP